MGLHPCGETSPGCQMCKLHHWLIVQSLWVKAALNPKTKCTTLQLTNHKMVRLYRFSLAFFPSDEESYNMLNRSTSVSWHLQAYIWLWLPIRKATICLISRIKISGMVSPSRKARSAHAEECRNMPNVPYQHLNWHFQAGTVISAYDEQWHNMPNLMYQYQRVGNL